jgi:transcriptional regulator with XRE-family HTH domain|nr:helix-turn-helix transcriptional regulator [Ruminococcus sp. 1001270H_150608_F2]DAN71724.1 MAG TPA: Helix-turn-helix XRE-family like protein [Caudoviricetes sp.]
MAMTLKTARVAKNLTQVEAAKKIGISVDTLANYEVGKSYPNIPILKMIERVYGVEYKDLIFLVN